MATASDPRESLDSVVKNSKSLTQKWAIPLAMPCLHIEILWYIVVAMFS